MFLLQLKQKMATIRKVRFKMYNSRVETTGDVDMIIEFKNGSTIKNHFKNTVLKTGREALVRSLTRNLEGCTNEAGEIASSFEYYIKSMIFGDGGESGGVPLYVDSNRNGLYGITRSTKPVISQVNPTNQTQGIFTSVLTYNDANGYAINEMALVMGTGDLYSMLTFGAINKTDQMQITWNWNLNFI